METHKGGKHHQGWHVCTLFQCYRGVLRGWGEGLGGVAATKEKKGQTGGNRMENSNETGGEQKGQISRDGGGPKQAKTQRKQLPEGQ